MIGIDVTPLVLGPRRGVARALLELLKAWHATPAGVPIHPISPAPLPSDIPRLAGAVMPDVPLTSHRALREVLPLLVGQHDIHVLLSPWSAFANLPIPVVAWVHEVPSARNGRLEGWRRTFADRRWLRRNVAECSGIVVPSRSTYRDVVALHPTAADNVHVIPNAFDPTPWRPRERIPPRHPYVIAVGIGHGKPSARKKGLDVLLRAWKQLPLPGHELVVVGRPALRMPPGVRVEEAPSDAELHRLVQAASMLVYPSRYEGFGYPPLEAMAAGTPVIAAEAGSIPEVVGEAGLLVPRGDHRALARAMRRVAGDVELEKRLVHAGYRRSRSFDPTKISRRFETLLRTVATRGRP